MLVPTQKHMLCCKTCACCTDTEGGQRLPTHRGCDVVLQQDFEGSVDWPVGPEYYQGLVRTVPKQSRGLRAQELV